MTTESVTGKHVLVVEDEPDFAALLRSILMKAGYTVATTYYSDQALSLVSELKPDLITLDIQMPRESGLFFYRKLKANEAFRHIPVVVVTGLTRGDKDMENLIRTFLEAENVPHPEAYVEKPVDGPHLLRTIEEVLLSSNCQSC
jgi:CheY-like chemotaxis protein